MSSLADSLSFDGASPITFDLTGSDDLTVSRETSPLAVLNSNPSPSTISSESPTVPVSPAATSQVVFPASPSIDSSGYLTSPAPSLASVPTADPVTTSPGLGLVSVPTAEGWDSRVNQDNLTQKTGETHITYCYSCGQYHSSKLGLQPLSSVSPNAPQGTRDYLLPPKTVNYSSPISVIENAISIAPRNTPIPKFATVNTQGSLGITSISNAEVFNLSSNPFSSKTIYLDFDGYNTSATAWNATSLGADRISSIAVFSLDSIVSTAYSQAEFDAMKEIFRRVAADYAPFGVNVTTKTPTFDQITRSSTSDSAYGTVVSIGNVGSQWSGAGGIAYVGIYDRVDTTNYYKPALVFPSRLGTAKNIAEAASHEAGHNLNLSHDGQGSTEYYTGGGSSPGWAPIMGVGYSKQLTQFSRGQYLSATNTENDFLQIRGEGIGRYVEGTPNTDLASAQTITLNPTGYGGAFQTIELVSDDGNTGIDSDYFKFTAPAAGSVSISVNNALIFSKDGTNFIGEDLPAGYGNLHLDAQILNASGGILADWNNNALVDVTGLNYSGLVAGQNYFVKVGPNSTLPDQSFGETTWGSLGAYALRIQADTNSTKTISIAKTTDGNEAGPVSSVFTLTRTGDLSSALIVNYTLGGTATPGVDYTGTTPNTVTFAALSPTATITLPTIDDSVVDPSETIITKITAPVGYTISGPDTATATIVDNDGGGGGNIFSNPNPITIPDSGTSTPYPSTINVSGLSGNINSLKVTLTNLSHTYPDDIDVLLVGPTGTKALLMSDVGGLSGVNNVTLTFEPTATSSLPDSGLITSGSYKATDFETGDIFNSPAPGGPYGTDFSVFNGINPNGTWSLYVVDDAGGDEGTIADGWSLLIGTAGATKSISIAKTKDGNEAGPVSSVFTLTRTGDLSSTLIVNYTLAGTATPGVDYTTPGAGKATFLAGSPTATITLPTIDDLLSDPGETIISKITAPAGYTISGPDTATATILDNDGNSANNNLVGTSFADALAGVGGNDTLSGLGGNDTLDGGADNDTYLFDTALVLGSDRLIDASGIDTLNFAATTTKTINLNLGSTVAQTVTAGNLTLTLASATDFENVIGGSLNDNIVGNTLANSLTGGLGKDILTGSTGLDTLNYNSLGESLLSGFDVIQGYSGTGASLDRINAPAPIAPITLTASKGTATALTEAAIKLVLTNAAFAANTAAAFKVTGQSGTFIALNNGAAGFQAASDAIIQLSGYNIAFATPVVVI